ncbi:NAD(P)-binding protein [Staphylococcus felis]|uniref:NAD(P)-binding protein n=1 Tax=Staphylococcus felis TaxID=46127 RepID=UPI003966D072
MSLSLNVNVDKMTILVVGGGRIATRRVLKLLNAQSTLIHVVSPLVTSTLNQLIRKNKLKWSKKVFQASDIQGAQFIIAATDNPKLHEKIKALIPSNVLFNDVIHHDASNIHFAKEVRRGRLSIQITTNGASPKLTQKIAKEIEEIYDHQYEGYVEFLYQCRKLIKQKPISMDEKIQLLDMLLEEKFMNADAQQEMLCRLRH